MNEGNLLDIICIYLFFFLIEGIFRFLSGNIDENRRNLQFNRFEKLLGIVWGWQQLESEGEFQKLRNYRRGIL